MTIKIFIVSSAALAVMTGFLNANPPVILSLQRNGALTWTNSITNGIAVVQQTTNLHAVAWSPFYYDASGYSRTSLYPYPYYVDVAKPSLRTTLLPPSSLPAAFFRLAIQTNAPDPNLFMHLPFDNDFTNIGVVLDVSGHGNHGLRYGRPGYPTNWPSATVGPDGSRAAEFHYYVDGWGDYGRSGDYIGIPTISDFTNLPQATMAFWCHYYADPAGCNCNSTPLQAGMGTGSWTIGRYYDTRTTCEVAVNDSSSPIVLTFPDDAPNNDTGGWHHYVVTFDHGIMMGYFDGTNCSSGFVPNQSLTVGGVYLSIAGWTFNESPWLDGSVPSKHPNNAWMNGAMDDVRIYNRALTATDVLSLYGSFDNQAPSTPQNVRLTIDSSTQIQVYWSSSTDNFRVAGYQVRRNGVTVATVPGTHYVDTGLTPQNAYSYTVQALDAGGNVSLESSPVMTNTPAGGTQVDVTVDNADGAPWAQVEGTWSLINVPNPPNYYGSSYLAGTTGKGSVSVTFHPTLPEPGNYSVFVWNPGSAAYSMWVFASNVPVDIVGAGITNTISLNQQIDYATWNYLGTYSFSAGTNGFVRVRIDGTAGDAVSADAVRFVK